MALVGSMAVTSAVITGTVVATSSNHNGMERQTVRTRSGITASTMRAGFEPDDVDNAPTEAPTPSNARTNVGSICELFGRTTRL